MYTTYTFDQFMKLPEILLIDKPKGITSFDVIRQLRKKTGIKKFGHAGTLDPAASGLLIIGVEQGTKKLTDYIKLDKEYEAEIRLGEQRSTGDLDGEVIDSVESVIIDTYELPDAVASLVGTLTLPVSAYSAIKKDGKPMYKRAHEAAKLGELVKDVPFRDMRIMEAEYLGHEELQTPEGHRVIVRVRFKVGSGTYIRSLAEELGRRLGYPATLQNLRRTKVGKFDISDAKKIEEL